MYFTCDTMLEKRGCECDSVKLAWKWDVIKFYQPACHENRSEPNYLSGQGYHSCHANLNFSGFDKHTHPPLLWKQRLSVVLVKGIILHTWAKRNPWMSCSQYIRNEIQYLNYSEIVWNKSNNVNLESCIRLSITKAINATLWNIMMYRKKNVGKLLGNI